MASSSMTLKTTQGRLTAEIRDTEGGFILSLLDPRNGLPVKAKALGKREGQAFMRTFAAAPAEFQESVVWSMFGGDALKHVNAKSMANTMFKPTRLSACH